MKDIDFIYDYKIRNKAFLIQHLVLAIQCISSIKKNILQACFSNNDEVWAI